MRIIAGEFRGRTLHAPDGQATRPTADRVRETLFSMLTSRLGTFEELQIADLFAGSGAFGFEALSRGAAFACFVEQAPKAQAAIRANAAALKVSERIRLVGGSALELPRSNAFELIFADPPYAAGSGSAAVQAIERAGWSAQGGWIAVETERGATVAPGCFETVSVRDVGRARLTLLRRP